MQSTRTSRARDTPTYSGVIVFPYLGDNSGSRHLLREARDLIVPLLELLSVGGDGGAALLLLRLEPVRNM